MPYDCRESEDDFGENKTVGKGPEFVFTSKEKVIPGVISGEAKPGKVEPVKYVIRYKAQLGRMVNDAWLFMGYGFSGASASEDIRLAHEFGSRKLAEDVLKSYRLLGGDGREPGVIEEFT